MLSATNPIENLFSRVREIARRVKHGEGGTMVLRWSATGVLEAEQHFHRIAGYQARAKLLAALNARDAKLNRTTRKIDAAKAAA